MKMIAVALMKESAVKVVQKQILSHDVFAVQVLEIHVESGGSNQCVPQYCVDLLLGVDINGVVTGERIFDFFFCHVKATRVMYVSSLAISDSTIVD